MPAFDDPEFYQSGNSEDRDREEFFKRQQWQEESPINSAQHVRGVSLEDFYAYMPTHNYIYIPAREMWPSGSVNARIPPITFVDPTGQPILDNKGNPKKVSAATWLDQNRPVEQMSWAPGLPQLIDDQLISHGGWIERKGVSCFNLYRAPAIRLGDAALAGPWLEHVQLVYPNDADHIIKWLAQRVQRPQEKINHAIVLGGKMGIGKDTIVEPVKRAVGPWNFGEIFPQQLLGRFNGFVKSVILRISEARDLGDVNRFQFYDHLKAYTAAPPDVLLCDEKNLREYSVPNCCGVIITTNYKTDGIYLPEDDRRHYVAWSELDKQNFAPAYWRKIYHWYDSGGTEHVAAYLASLDIYAFDPKAPPPQTEAFWAIVNASRAPEDAELATALEALREPDVVWVTKIAAHTSTSFAEWLLDRKNSRRIPHRFEECSSSSWRTRGRLASGEHEGPGSRSV